MIIRKRSEFPKCVRHFKELKGICVGRCIDKTGSIERNGHIAHAHSSSEYGYMGWICLAYKYQLKEKFTLLHEIAHLIACKSIFTSNHGDRWRKAVVKIGGTYEPYWSYTKKKIYHDFSPKKLK